MKHHIKFLLIVCLNLTFTITVFSQCGTILTQQQVDYMNETRLIRSETGISLFSISSEPITLSLIAHIVRDSQGDGGLTKDMLNSGIEKLNIAFENADIIFELCDINYINNNNYFTSLTKSWDSQSEEYEMAKPNLVPNAVNVFFLPKIVNSINEELCGWSSFPSFKNDFEKDWTVMANHCVEKDNVFAHELGHYFNLYHTHQGDDVYLNVFGNELVDRSNCGPNVGDELCDTPAEPVKNQKGFDGIFDCVSQNCNFNCSDVDSLGVRYKLDGINIMSYGIFSDCVSYFSPQQIVRIQESLAYDRSYLSIGCVKCVYGCMDETAINYNSEANCDDDSCEYVVYGCTNPSACNYNYAANEDDGSCNFGNINCPNPCIHCFIPGCTAINACNYNPDANVDNGSCEYGNANCPDPCTPCIIRGCTNENACNYNPQANQEDNTCDFGNVNCPDHCIPCIIRGCTNENACNYNPQANQEDNTCNFGNSNCPNPCAPCTIPGCTKENACNYNPLANRDDGTCDFGNVNCPDPCKPCIIPGCTNENACNYNPLANQEDSTCDFGNVNCPDPCKPCIIPGCTKENACNYNPLANQDDGTCDFGNLDCEDPCNPCIPLISCNKNSGKIVSLMCERSFNYYIETDKGEYFIPVFDQILPFRIKQGKKINFDYKVVNKQKGSLSTCKYGDTKVIITCIEEVIENKPGNLFDESFDSGFSPFGSSTSNQVNSPFLIYPNPSKGELFIMIENENLQTNTLNVYNINGEQVNIQTSIEMIGGIIELDLSAQAKGIYLVELRKGDYIFTQKVLIE